MARTVFVCDADQDARAIIHSFLSARGYDVCVMPTGQDLLASVVRERPDAILLDLFLPDLNGWEMVARLKSDPATASIPIIIASVLSQEETGVSLRELAGWIQKPFTEAELTELWAKAISK
jgi:DNA-binding response OmpR family regulator